jgi:hypothetical protein
LNLIVYGLCALTAAACATLLLRAYFRNRFRLLLWSGLCFVGLTLNNVILVLDRAVFPAIDLSMWRLGTAVVAVFLLVGGLIFDGDT